MAAEEPSRNGVDRTMPSASVDTTVPWTATTDPTAVSRAWKSSSRTWYELTFSGGISACILAPASPMAVNWANFAVVRTTPIDTATRIPRRAHRTFRIMGNSL